MLSSMFFFSIFSLLQCKRKHEQTRCFTLKRSIFIYLTTRLSEAEGNERGNEKCTDVLCAYVIDSQSTFAVDTFLVTCIIFYFIAVTVVVDVVTVVSRCNALSRFFVVIRDN